MSAAHEKELLPIDGIGPKTAKLLVAGGIAGLAGLAAADAAKLAKLQGLPPNADTAAWIAEAKQMAARDGGAPPPSPASPPSAPPSTKPKATSDETRRFPVEWDLRIHGKLYTPNKRGPDLTEAEHAELLAAGVVTRPWAKGEKAGN